MPNTFASWVKWKFGNLIAQEYMLPYNRKIWAIDPDLLGTYWLHKLPNVSFRETLLSCLEAKSTGELPAHGTFLYPKKFGYGEVWRRMGEALGESVMKNCKIDHIDLATLTVNGQWQAETIISSIPWTLWEDFCELPSDILTLIKSLAKASIDVDYHPDTLRNLAHWIYEPDESISHHRLLLRSNFVSGSKGYWTEANSKNSKQSDVLRFYNEFAYPINSLAKPDAIRQILAWGQTNNIIGLGRWGKWEHMNSDVAVAEALQKATELEKSEH